MALKPYGAYLWALLAMHVLFAFAEQELAVAPSNPPFESRQRRTLKIAGLFDDDSISVDDDASQLKAAGEKCDDVENNGDDDSPGSSCASGKCRGGTITVRNQEHWTSSGYCCTERAANDENCIGCYNSDYNGGDTYGGKCSQCEPGYSLFSYVCYSREAMDFMFGDKGTLVGDDEDDNSGCWDAQISGYSCSGYTGAGYTCVGLQCAAMNPGGTPRRCAVRRPSGWTVNSQTGKCYPTTTATTITTSTTCGSGFLGNSCQYSDETTCSAVGSALYNGTCICPGPVVGIGDHCQYSNAATCSVVGTAQTDGSCICPGPEDGIGKSCQYSNEKTCNSVGEAQDDGSCVCNKGHAGPSCEYSDALTCGSVGEAQDDGSCVCIDGHAGPACEYSDALTCNSVGEAQDDGSCVCIDGYAGPVCEYSDVLTCNSVGTAQDDGSCLCERPLLGVGPSCQYNNKNTCNNLGVAQPDGSCKCKGPEIGVGPVCMYNNKNTCSNAGIAQIDGSCSCCEQNNGPACEYSDKNNCRNAGDVRYDGSCECYGPQTGVGSACQFTNAETCSDAGVAQPDGSCECYGPETGVGPSCSEYSHGRTCQNLGEVDYTNIKANPGKTADGPQWCNWRETIKHMIIKNPGNKVDVGIIQCHNLEEGLCADYEAKPAFKQCSELCSPECLNKLVLIKRTEDNNAPLTKPQPVITTPQAVTSTTTQTALAETKDGLWFLSTSTSTAAPDVDPHDHDHDHDHPAGDERDTLSACTLRNSGSEGGAADAEVDVDASEDTGEGETCWGGLGKGCDTRNKCSCPSGSVKTNWGSDSYGGGGCWVCCLGSDIVCLTPIADDDNDQYDDGSYDDYDDDDDDDGNRRHRRNAAAGADGSVDSILPAHPSLQEDQPIAAGGHEEETASASADGAVVGVRRARNFHLGTTTGFDEAADAAGGVSGGGTTCNGKQDVAGCNEIKVFCSGENGKEILVTEQQRKDCPVTCNCCNKENCDDEEAAVTAPPRTTTTSPTTTNTSTTTTTDTSTTTDMCAMCEATCTEYVECQANNMRAFKVEDVSALLSSDACGRIAEAMALDGSSPYTGVFCNEENLLGFASRSECREVLAEILDDKSMPTNAANGGVGCNKDGLLVQFDASVECEPMAACMNLLDSTSRARENFKFIPFYLTVLPLLFLCFLTACLCLHCRSDKGWGSSAVASMVLTFKTFDLSSDWGLNMISMDNFRFTETGRMGALQKNTFLHLKRASTFFCVVGTITFFVDLWAFRKEYSAKSNTISRKTRGKTLTAVVVFEDVPQIIICGLYLDAVGLDLTKDQLAIACLAISVVSVIYNLVVIYFSFQDADFNPIGHTVDKVGTIMKSKTSRRSNTNVKMNPAFDVGFKSPTGTEKCGWEGASGNLCAAPSTRGRQCERHTCTIETCQRGKDSSALVCSKHSAENNIGKKKPKAKKIAEIAGGGSKKKSKKKGTTEIKGGSKKNATKSKDDRHAGGMPTGSKKKSKKKGAAEIKDGKKQGVKARSKKKEAAAPPESPESMSSCGWPKASGKDCAKATRAGRHCEKHTCTEDKCRRGKDGKAKFCKKHERTKEDNVMQGEALVVALSDGEAAADLPEESYGGFEEADRGATPDAVKETTDELEDPSETGAAVVDGRPIDAVALFAYTAADAEEVSFEKGDALVDVSHLGGEEGWLVGTVVRTGATGSLPSNYVELQAGANSDDGDEEPDVGDDTGDLRMEALLEAADASGADGYLEVGGTSE